MLKALPAGPFWPAEGVRMFFRKSQFSIARILSPTLLALAAMNAHAAEAPTSTSVEPAPKRLSLDAVFQTSSSLHRLEDPSHSAALDVVLAPSLTVTDSLKLLGKFAVNQDLSGERKLLVQNGGLQLRHKGVQLAAPLSLSPAIGVGLPFSKKSFRQESLIMSGNGGARLTLATESGFSTFLDLTGSRSVHQFTTSTTGASNTKWGANARLFAAYTFLSRFTVSNDLLRTSRFTYLGNIQNQFDFTQELSFQALPSIALAVGHNNAGAALKANQLDSNVKLYDENSSTVYGSMTLSF